MIDGKTHELKIHASNRHKACPAGTMILHLWFDGESAMQMDLDVALKRPDVDYVEVIDCVEHTTTKLYARGEADAVKRSDRRPGRAR